MFLELETALRFLRPRKTQLARTLIAFSSIGVVSVVTWLVLVFYSVTEGLEKRWVDQLIQVTGSVRVMPSLSYFQKTDFLIDSYCQTSAYQPTTLIDKVNSPSLFSELESEVLPKYLQEAQSPSWKRPSYRIWKKLENYHPAISLSSSVQLDLTQFRERYQEINPSIFASAGSYRLQQSGYILGFYPQSQPLEKLIELPQIQDLNTLMLSLGQYELQQPWPCLEKWLQEASLTKAHWKRDEIPLWPVDTSPLHPTWIHSNEWSLEKTSFPFWNSTLKRWVHEVSLKAKTEINAKEFKAWIPAGFIDIKEALAKPWTLNLSQENSSKWTPLLASKMLKEAGLQMGSLVSLQKEMAGPLGISLYKREGIIVGFYDSGIMPLGGRFLITDYESILPWIEPAEQDPQSQFFQAWPENPIQTANDIRDFLKKEGLDTLFNVQSYEDFEASRDLIMQLRSDRLLLSLIAFIILIVASSSVCTMMVLLVNERRKEIAVLKTLGMSSVRLCSCFALCGLILGALGACIGVSLAWITLENLDPLIGFISYLQGQPLLNPAYYGKNLPSTMSIHAVKMALCGNMILAFLGSTLAAWQTSRLTPPDLFRSL